MERNLRRHRESEVSCEWRDACNKHVSGRTHMAPARTRG